MLETNDAGQVTGQTSGGTTRGNKSFTYASWEMAGATTKDSAFEMRQQNYATVGRGAVDIHAFADMAGAGGQGTLRFATGDNLNMMRYHFAVGGGNTWTLDAFTATFDAGANSSLGVGLVIQVDANSDGVADGPTLLSAGSSISYDSAGVPQDQVTGAWAGYDISPSLSTVDIPATQFALPSGWVGANAIVTFTVTCTGRTNAAGLFSTTLVFEGRA
jgi:hypothetical protein